MFTQTIPVLNLQDFLTGSRQRKQLFINGLGEALEHVGFFALTDHGVDAELIQSAYRAMEAFFLLPEAVKHRYTLPALKGQRGFTRFGQEHAKDSEFPDLKEFWHVGRESQPGQVGNRPANLWPAEVPQFQPILAQLYAQLDTCAAHLLEACACYLGEAPALLRQMAIDSDTILRLIHYPPISPDTHPSSLRAAPHEDINLITLLCEATASGLELRQRDGTWLPIPALPGQIIVDSGDMLQHLTNGLFRSTTHRVVNPNDDRERRFSMPFFVHPRSEVDLSPLPGCVARTGGECRFPALTAGEYLHQRLREIGLA